MPVRSRVGQERVSQGIMFNKRNHQIRIAAIHGGIVASGNGKRVRALAIACVAALAATMAHGEDLIDVYAMARQSDPTFLAARNELEALSTAEPAARSALLPLITFEWDKNRTRQNILSSTNAVFASGGSTYPTDNRILTLTQPIFRLGAWKGYEQAKVKVRQATAVFGAAEQDLMLRTAAAYLNVLAARDSLSFAEAERASIKSQLDLVQQRYTSGLVTVVGLYDAKARYALKESDVIAAQRDLNDQEQALREITGSVVPRIKPVRDDILLEQPSPSNINTWVDSALEKNLVLEGRRLGVEVARVEIDRQRAGHAPSLDLVATGNRKDTGGSLFGGGSVVETNDLMLRLTVPIYSGGLVIALTKEASARHLQAQNLLERDRRQVERQARAAYEGVTSGIVRVRALGESVVAQESARKLKEEGYRSGLQTVLAVLDAERDLYSARRDSAKARYEFLLNRLRLKQAVGTLNEDDLAAINKSLQ